MPANIILIMTDDQAAKTLWSMGQSVFTGAHGKLIKKGIAFLNSFTVASQCEPSRTSMLTGQYPHNHGLYSNGSPPPHGFADLDQNTLLPVWLQSAGYRTMLAGKYLNHWGAGSPIPPGWNDWYGFLVSEYYNYDMNENGAIVHYGSSDADYSTTQLAARAASLIASHASSSQPFFMWLGFNAPHAPFTPSSIYTGAMGSTAAPPRVPGWNESNLADKPAHTRNMPGLGALGFNAWSLVDETWRKQIETLLSVNDAIDTIVNALTAAGKLGSTYIIFTSDNGWMSGEHRIPSSKAVPYEPSIRVPFVITGPDVQAEMTRTELVANIDVTATIVEISGAVPTRVLDGKSLLLLLTSSIPVPTFRNHLLIEFMANLSGSYPIAGGPTVTMPAYVGLRSNEWKYVKYNTDETELYDMINDPYELRSLHADPNYETVRNDLDALLSSSAVCAGASCRL